MVNRFQDPLLTPAEAARHLDIPPSTLHDWLGEVVEGGPLVHQLPARRRGWPTLPFVAVVEAFVLDAMRELGLSLESIRIAVVEARRAFGSAYALAQKGVRTDGVDLFLHLSPGELLRTRDHQEAMGDVMDLYLRDISFDERGRWPTSLRLRRYGDADVVIDPRYAWGAPIIRSRGTPIEAVVALWKAGEPVDVVADEFELPHELVESVCRDAA